MCIALQKVVLEVALLLVLAVQERMVAAAVVLVLVLHLLPQVTQRPIRVRDAHTHMRAHLLTHMHFM